MAKQKLNKARSPKSEARSRSPRAATTFSKLLPPQYTTDEDDSSVLTWPWEAAVPPPMRSTKDDSFDHHFPARTDELHTTLTNEENSVHVLELLSDEESSEIVSVPPSGGSRQVGNPHKQTQGGNDSLSYAEARQNSLLDALSSVSESTFDSFRRDSSLNSKPSTQASKSWMGISSRASSSRMGHNEDFGDEESSWGGVLSYASSKKPQQQPSVHQNRPSPRGGMPNTTNQERNRVWEKTNEKEPMKGDQQDEEEEEWSDSFVSSRIGSQLGPSYSTEPSGIVQAQSSSSDVVSTSSSIARFRNKWRAKRRVHKRNHKWNTEQDWFTENENEDWPGATPHHRAFPNAIAEEQEDEEDDPSESAFVELSPSLSSPPPPRKRSFLSRFFACSS